MLNSRRGVRCITDTARAYGSRTTKQVTAFPGQRTGGFRVRAKNTISLFRVSRNLADYSGPCFCRYITSWLPGLNLRTDRDSDARHKYARTKCITALRSAEGEKSEKDISTPRGSRRSAPLPRVIFVRERMCLCTSTDRGFRESRRHHGSPPAGSNAGISLLTWRALSTC
jgi:hypothetical protein